MLCLFFFMKAIAIQHSYDENEFFWIIGTLLHMLQFKT